MATAIKINRLTPEQAAYLAGLIDGEGTITLTRMHRHENRRLVMSISNNDLSLRNLSKQRSAQARSQTRRPTANAMHVVLRIRSQTGIAQLRAQWGNEFPDFGQVFTEQSTAAP